MILDHVQLDSLPHKVLPILSRSRRVGLGSFALSFPLGHHARSGGRPLRALQAEQDLSLGEEDHLLDHLGPSHLLLTTRRNLRHSPLLHPRRGGLPQPSPSQHRGTSRRKSHHIEPSSQEWPTQPDHRPRSRRIQVRGSNLVEKSEWRGLKYRKRSK